MRDLSCSITIIGGGVAGIEAALVAGRQGNDVILIDSGTYRNANAQAMHMYLGMHGENPAVLQERGLQEARDTGNVRVMSGEVATIDSSDGLKVVLLDGPTIHTRRLIMATGVSDQLEGLPGLDKLFGRGVYHCPFCDGFENRDRHIAVFCAPGQPLIKAAFMSVYLSDHFSDDVTLITNGQEIPEQARPFIDGSNVKICSETLVELSGNNGAVLLHFESGEMLEVESAFCSPETKASAVVEELDVEKQGAHILVDVQHRSSNPAIFAVGDCAVMRGEQDALTFVAQGITAGQRAALWADKDAFFERVGA